MIFFGNRIGIGIFLSKTVLKSVRHFINCFLSYRFQSEPTKISSLNFTILNTLFLADVSVSAENNVIFGGH
jgi:hypothetical protein